MLNYIWLGLVVFAVIIGGYHNIAGAPTGTLKEMTDKGFEMAKVAVIDIAFPLIGIMALFPFTLTRPRQLSSHRTTPTHHCLRRTAYRSQQISRRSSAQPGQR